MHNTGDGFFRLTDVLPTISSQGLACNLTVTLLFPCIVEASLKLEHTLANNLWDTYNIRWGERNISIQKQE